MTNNITVEDICFGIEKAINNGDDLMAELGILALSETLNK